MVVCLSVCLSPHLKYLLLHALIWPDGLEIRLHFLLVKPTATELILYLRIKITEFADAGLKT
jgi:hypothetical protein